MAGQVAARLKGDDYQHLYGWFLALQLLMPGRRVERVIVEDEEAGSADDVTVHYAADHPGPDLYHQVKYHVDQRGAYSVDLLTDAEDGGRSLLQKWFRSWKTLREKRPGRAFQIHITSNWGWAEGDLLAPLVADTEGEIKDEFFDASGRTNVGKLRQRLIDHLGVDPGDFEAFARSLRFHLGYVCWQKLAEQTAERMEHRGLKFDSAALLIGVGVVREWVKAGHQDVTAETLREVAARFDLTLPPNAEPGVAVYLTTIKDQKFDVPPDYVLDWRTYFEGPDNKRGHELKDPHDWNGTLLPQLEALERTVNSDTHVRLIRARGLARLSCWTAFGHMFSEVNRYTIEIDQQGKLWRSDADPSVDFVLATTALDGDVLATDGDTVAIGVSVTGSLEVDMRAHLAETGAVRAVLFLRPERDLGPQCLRDASDAVALANGVKEHARAFVKRHGARTLRLYYFGPLAGACFIGHRLNAVCRHIVIYERSDPGYVPSFTLT